MSVKNATYHEGAPSAEFRSDKLLRTLGVLRACCEMILSFILPRIENIAQAVAEQD